MFNGLSYGYNKRYISHFFNSKKQHETTNTDFFLPIEHISTRTIALNICRYISDKGCGAISTIGKKIESEYDLVKCTSDNYTLQYSNKIVKGIIKAGELVCDALYLNPLANFKLWYTSMKNKPRKKIVSLNNVIF